MRQLRGVVPWAGLVDRRRPRSTFPRSPIRGRECRSWRCQGEGCEVARTQFGSSQVAEEASARAGAGAETRACHHDLLAAGGEPPTLQGGQPRGVLTLRALPARSMPPPSQEAGPASPSTPQLSKCVQRPAPPIPPPVPRRNSLEHKAHALLKPLITGLPPKAPATPNRSEYLSRPGFSHTSADAVPSAWKALLAARPAQLRLKTPLPREALRCLLAGAATSHFNSPLSRVCAH